MKSQPKYPPAPMPRYDPPLNTKSLKLVKPVRPSADSKPLVYPPPKATRLALRSSEPVGSDDRDNVLCPMQII